MRQAEKVKKKKFSPEFCSYPTRPRELQKKKRKKIQKTKKLNSGIISIQNGLREAENERKKLLSRIPFILDQGKKIPKKIAEKFEKLKNLFPALFLAKTRQAEKEKK